MDASKLVVRNMNAEELAANTITWNNLEGWNKSKLDAKPFLAADPHGFFVGELDGEAVASVSAVKYTNYSHFSNYFVKRGFRANGYGLKVFQHAMEYAKTAKTIGLDAVETQTANYAKWGFKSHERCLYSKKTVAEKTSHSNPNLIDLKNLSIQILAEYDQIGFGDSRKSFLEAVISQEGYHSLGLVEDSKLRGYGVLRKMPNGYKIGPFVADNKDVAVEIIKGLENLVSGDPLVVFLFENNQPMREALAELNFIDDTMYFFRMYLGDLPNRDLTKAYAIVSELG